MRNIEHKESDINNTPPIQEYLGAIETQENELVLTSKGNIVGAILTAEQYNWFLDKIDECQNISEISKRVNDRDGEQSLDNLKKELGE